MQWWLKSCPKCRGDIFQDRFWRESSYKCLQCGHILDRLEEARLGLAPARDTELPATVGGLVRRKAA